ncbi:MAG: ECF transporter S component [Gemmatimonadaceae bacterium]
MQLISEARVMQLCYSPVSIHAKSHLSTVVLALVPRAVALNLVLGAVVGALKLPLYLDSTGTILVAVLAGPMAGMLTGLVSNLVLGLLSSPTFFGFIPVALVIGAVAGWWGRVGAFQSVWAASAAGVSIGLAAGLASVPIVCALFGCVTASGSGLITVGLRALGIPLTMAASLASVSTDIVDKTLSCALVALVIDRLPRRITQRLAGARR